MSTVKPSYGTNTAITATHLNSLASAAYWNSAVIDNTTNLFEDALVAVIIATASASTSATGYCTVYAAAEIDGTNFTDTGAIAGEGTVTPSSPTVLKLIGVMTADVNSTTYYGGPWSVAKGFGGILPPKWVLIVQNNTGTTLSASGNSASYMGYNTTIV